MATRKGEVRKATCSYGNHGAVASRPTLAFFKSREAGSEWAKRTCSLCGYAPRAHEPEVAAKPHMGGRTDHPFVEHAGEDTDVYYCGCYGWD